VTATIAGSAATMTIGQLSRRTGLSVKVLRRLEGMGFIYTAGRSPAGYRLFDEDALWCVQVLGTLRGLGLTLAEIRELEAVYLAQPDRPIGPYLVERLRVVRARLDERIGELRALRRRIDDFEVTHQAELGGLGRGRGELFADDPRHGCRAAGA
jgi:MerR family transcriptional regulator, copper efflux regulator